MIKQLRQRGGADGPGHERAGPHKPLINQLLADNVWNASVIFQLIHEQGYTGDST
jgi:hypothetical protein